jgi:curli biogenesis system outer membrane secretion channel CsgG
VKLISVKHGVVAAVLFFLMCGPVAATVKIAALPHPQPSAKLRVFVVVTTAESKTTKRPVFWVVSPEELRESNTRAINKMLQDQGIYEVVSAEDIHAVLGNQTISSWEWTAKKMALLKNAGKALQADYALLFERSHNVHLQFDMNLVNLNTGKEFSVSNYIPSRTLERLHNEARKQAGMEAIKISYRQLFTAAKSDFMQTAISKGKRSAEKMKQQETNASKSTDVSEKQVEAHQESVIAQTAGPVLSAIGNTQTMFEKELAAVIFTKDKKSVGPRLVVYDFDAVDRLKVAGLILTEALREELHNSGGFILVNRENILKIMDEYKLQQSGLVDEAQAVKMGKWLAANEAVTGNLAELGATSILQVKRVDIKTLGTIALGSLTCPSGREDELLVQMPGLAKKLSQPAR